MQEDQMAEAQKDIKNMATKNKKLQEFYDKHSTILAERESELTAQILKIKNEKEESERTLQKELDSKKTELETYAGELKVRMMKIRLKEIELENQIIDEKEKSELRDEELIQVKKENQKQKQEISKLNNTCTYLRNKKDELDQQLKDLMNAGDEDE
mmetsp:Transcript_26387/g.35256  ORF Transcript_26387/g.35256 Transcript_26387/m.35256 type:complete len:156 (+) Transcript_26387:1134-1601(+)